MSKINFSYKGVSPRNQELLESEDWGLIEVLLNADMFAILKCEQPIEGEKVKVSLAGSIKKMRYFDNILNGLNDNVSQTLKGKEWYCAVAKY